MYGLAACIGKTDSNMVIAPFRECTSTERQRFLALHLRKLMFSLVADIHFSDVDSLYWEQRQRHAPYRILRVSVNRVSTIFSFPFWLIYVPIGCRHPFIKYWKPLLAKTPVKWSLPHPEN